jgi:hypothetical protein
MIGKSYLDYEYSTIQNTLLEINSFLHISSRDKI